jgi:hypothetical protein
MIRVFRLQLNIIKRHTTLQIVVLYDVLINSIVNSYTHTEQLIKKFNLVEDVHFNLWANNTRNSRKAEPKFFLLIKNERVPLVIFHYYF